MKRWNTCWLALTLGMIVMQATSATAGEKITVGKKATRLVSFDQVSHAAWDKMLKQFCDRDGYVDYAGWKRSKADQIALDKYLATLSAGNPKAPSSPEGKLAFWINAYNAVTVWGILHEFPTTSIRNHTAKVFGYNIWHDLLLTVGDETVSLDTIEHKILRKAGENRIHFAIVCASVGCPRLRNEAYSKDKLEAQLADNTRDFFSRSTNFRIDRATHVVQVSSILDWFGEDFGETPQAGLASLADYLPKSAGAALAQGQFSVKYLDYDWALNDQATRNTARR
ncbi:MAG TPA: DUF547 domain-containing protein [Pirellulales bacterium]|nr:DUF547 domain-containing protein [Pirellulales bacterium]